MSDGETFIEGPLYAARKKVYPQAVSGTYRRIKWTGLILTLLMVYTYRRAMNAQKTQSSVQLRTDYGEKEDAILRSIISLAPNRAIRAMQSGSSASTTVSDPLSWQAIFTEALDLANSRTSIPTSRPVSAFAIAPSSDMLVT